MHTNVSNLPSIHGLLTVCNTNLKAININGCIYVEIPDHVMFKQDPDVISKLALEMCVAEVNYSYKGFTYVTILTNPWGI